MICSVEGCEVGAIARGYCSRHWQRWRRYGSPAGGGHDRGAAAKFLNEEAANYVGDDCLIWPYLVNANGYGYANSLGPSRIVHRLLCEKVYGPPPTPKHDAAHNCGNRLCVNPGHLRWDTRAGNKADELVHGTRNRGERQGSSKLTAANVLEIRRLRGIVTQRDLAAQFNVCQQAICNIQTHKSWSWLIGEGLAA